MNVFNSTIKATLKKYNPQIIGVTGAVGRAVAIGALKSVFSSHSVSVMPQGDMHSMKAALLGGSGNLSGLVLLLKAWLRSIFHWEYPEKIILDYPPIGHAELKERLDLARPDVLVVTDLADKSESNVSREEMVRAVAHMIESVGQKGLVVLNADDSGLMSLKPKARAMTYGFGDLPDVKINNFEDRVESGKSVGISFKLEYMGSFVPVRMDGVSGKSYACAAACAAAVGIADGMNLVKVSEAVSTKA